MALSTYPGAQVDRKETALFFARRNRRAATQNANAARATEKLAQTSAAFVAGNRTVTLPLRTANRQMWLVGFGVNDGFDLADNGFDFIVGIEKVRADPNASAGAIVH